MLALDSATNEKMQNKSFEQIFLKKKIVYKKKVQQKVGEMIFANAPSPYRQRRT